MMPSISSLTGTEGQRAVMAINKPMSSAVEAEAPPWQELDRVTLRVARQERGSQAVPAGSDGTIVAVLKGGEAYIVEFVRPVQALVTVEPEDIGPVKSAFA